MSGDSKINVAIIGSGPGSVYIYQACIDNKINPIIISKSRVNFVPGAFWLRWVPAKFENLLRQENIVFYSRGNYEEYEKIQWGRCYGNSSFPSSSRVETGYNPSKALAVMSRNMKFDPTFPHVEDRDIRRICSEYDLVFLTFPMESWLKSRAYYLVSFPIYTSCKSADHNYTIYNGVPGSKIVRESNLFGKKYIEFSHFATRNDVMNSLPVFDSTERINWIRDFIPECPELDSSEIPSKNLKPIGRYAQFKRKMLSHEAYSEANKIIKEYL